MHDRSVPGLFWAVSFGVLAACAFAVAARIVGIAALVGLLLSLLRSFFERSRWR